MLLLFLFCCHTVFLVQPDAGPLRTTIGTQIELNCVINSDQYIAGWSIVLPGETVAINTLSASATELQQLASRGITVITTVGVSMLVVGGTEGNNSTMVQCAAQVLNATVLGRENVEVLFYGMIMVAICQTESVLHYVNTVVMTVGYPLQGSIELHITMQDNICITCICNL